MTTIDSAQPQKVTRLMSYGVGLILVLVPFQAFFATWLGATFGYLDVFRIWKEGLLLILLAGLLLPLYRRKELKFLFSSRLGRLTAAYLLLHIILGAAALTLGKVSGEALLYALIVNLRFLLFFMAAYLVVRRDGWLAQHWQKLVLIPASLVIAFALLQQFVLPIDFLRHFGYGPDTIPAYQAVDLKPDFARVQSFLRGANPLGAYLVLIGTLLLGLLLKNKQKLQLGAAVALAGVALFFTYSRSAWLGLLVSGGLSAWLFVRSRRLRTYIVAGSLAALVLAVSLIWLFRDQNTIQNTFFHSDETSVSAKSSNEQRRGALRQGAIDVVREPWGRGPGTAGPASARNNGQLRIAENYFLQIGQEVGILGAGLFIGINTLIAYRLWGQRRQLLARVLLSSLAGITIVNLLSHAWTDDTLAYLWWGLAGIALASPAILGVKRTKYEKEKA